MDPKRSILAHLARRKSAGGAELRTRLGITRQALSIHLRALIDAGKVVRSGATCGARYALASRAPAFAVVFRALRAPGFDEGRV